MIFCISEGTTGFDMVKGELEEIRGGLDTDVCSKLVYYYKCSCLTAQCGKTGVEVVRK